MNMEINNKIIIVASPRAYFQHLPLPSHRDLHLLYLASICRDQLDQMNLEVVLLLHIAQPPLMVVLHRIVSNSGSPWTLDAEV